MIKLKTSILRDALNKVAKVCSFKPELPLTFLIEIKTEEDKLSVMGTDGLSTLIVNSKLDEPVESMRAVVDAKIVSNLLSKITTEFVELNMNKQSLTITGNGVYELELRVDEAGEIVSFPLVEFNMDEAKDELNLKSLVSKLLVSMNIIPEDFDDKELRYCYVGDNVVTAGPSVITSIENDEDMKNKEFYFRPEYLNIITTLPYEKAKYLINEENFIIGNNDFTLVTKRSKEDEEYLSQFKEVTYVNIKKLTEAELKNKAKINRSTILGLVDRLSLFVSEYENYALYFKFMPDKLIVSSGRDNGKEEFSLKDPQTEGLVEYTVTYSLIDLKRQLEALNQDEVEIQFDNESEIIKFVDGKIIEIVGPIDPEGAQ